VFKRKWQRHPAWIDVLSDVAAKWRPRVYRIPACPYCLSVENAKATAWILDVPPGIAYGRQLCVDREITAKGCLLTEYAQAAACIVDSLPGVASESHNCVHRTLPCHYCLPT